MRKGETGALGMRKWETGALGMRRSEYRAALDRDPAPGEGVIVPPRLLC